MKREGSKHNYLLSGLYGLLILTGVFFAANMGAVLAFVKRNVGKMKQHENENNLMETFLLQKEEHILKPDIRNAYLAALESSVRIIVPKPEKEQMNIEILSFASIVEIELPTGVEIHCKGLNGLDFEKEGKEPGPVINLDIKDRLTSLTIGFSGADDAKQPQEA
ncbi:MAG: hypothetical protein K6F53_07160 [Lachnospiraceae bacterium]|nr:hypothetical protein [Lachnospiraceae bacterium]